MTRSNSAAAILQGEARVLEVIDKHTQVTNTPLSAPCCQRLVAAARHGCCRWLIHTCRWLQQSRSAIGQLLLGGLLHSSHLSPDVRVRGTTPVLTSHEPQTCPAEVDAQLPPPAACTILVTAVDPTSLLTASPTSLQIVMHSFQPGGLVGRLCAPREMCCVRSWRQVSAPHQLLLLTGGPGFRWQW